MTKFKTIKFRKEFIQGILHGKKTATTRLKRKPFGVYQVISVGDRGKQTLLQLFIEIESVLSWKLINEARLLDAIVHAENYRDWSEYKQAICEIYGEDPALGFKRKRTVHTHFFTKVDKFGV